MYLICTSGNQYRAKTCDWGNQTCKSGSGYGQESTAYCSGPDIEVCSLPYQGFGHFEEITLNGMKRNIRSSPSSCVRDKITDCDHGTMVWTHWLDWRIDKTTEYSIQRSRQRYCLHKQSGSNDCLFQEENEEECCLGDPDSCTDNMHNCYSSLE